MSAQKSSDGGTVHPSDTVSHFLECVYYITEVDEVVRPGRLAAWLGVKAPTVTDMIRRMVRDGWVQVDGDRSIRLTPQGVDTAAAIVRRHRILERWLVDVLGLDWAAADVEAERIATSVSEEVIDRIDQSMGQPVTCPHGNVIPGRTPRYGSLVTLSQIAPGETVSVRRVSEVAEHEAHSLLTELGEMGISEGTQVRVVSTDNDVATMILGIGAETVELPVANADLVWVERDTALAR